MYILILIITINALDSFGSVRMFINTSEWLEVNYDIVCIQRKGKLHVILFL